MRTTREAKARSKEAAHVSPHPHPKKARVQSRKRALKIHFGRSGLPAATQGQSESKEAEQQCCGGWFGDYGDFKRAGSTKTIKKAGDSLVGSSRSCKIVIVIRDTASDPELLASRAMIPEPCPSVKKPA